MTMDTKQPCALCGGTIGPDTTGRPMCYHCGPGTMMQDNLMGLVEERDLLRARAEQAEREVERLRAALNVGTCAGVPTFSSGQTFHAEDSCPFRARAEKAEQEVAALRESLKEAYDFLTLDQATLINQRDSARFLVVKQFKDLAMLRKEVEKLAAEIGAPK